MRDSVWRVAAFLIGVLVVGLPVSVHAQDDGLPASEREVKRGVQVGLGAALIVRAEPYRDLDDDTEILAIPLLSVETRRFSWQGPRLAYKLLDDERWALDLVTAWRFFGVDPDDSDFLEGMADRDATLEAGARVAYATERTVVEVRGAFDTLDRHGGFDMAFKFGLPQRFGRLVLTPSIGVEYLNDEFVDYYFGVRPGEATSARPEYEARDAWNAVLGLDAVYPINTRWIFIGGLQQEWLDSAITASPIVDSDTRVSLFAGFSRRLGRSTGR